MNFAPSIKVGRETVTPKGYAWVLGFALAGCEWAVIEASKPEFLEMVRADLEKDCIASLEAQIKRYESKISEIKTELGAFCE